MSVADLGMEDGSLVIIKREIDEVFGDTSVPPGETRERMIVIRDYVQESIDALDEDLEENE